MLMEEGRLSTFWGMGPPSLVRKEMRSPQWLLADISATTRTTGHILLLQAVQERGPKSAVRKVARHSWVMPPKDSYPPIKKIQPASALTTRL